MQSSNETCDWCEEYKPTKFATLTRGFCSAQCANAYLKGEGFEQRICINCEQSNVYGGQLVCDKCIEGNSMTAAYDERANMSSAAIVKSHAQAIAESVDWESVGIDPIMVITWVQMISKLLEFVLPTLAECLHMNDDATPSTAQQRVATLQSRNSERLLRRTKLNIAKQNRRSARKDSSIQLLDDAQTTVLAKAIIGHTLRDNECGAVFAACLQQVA